MSLKESNCLREIADLKKGLSILSIDCTKRALEKFQTYLEILYEYRNKIHLLSHQDYNRISRRHFLTSLVAFPYLKERTNVCDIGAGAGFPSVPLSILKPELNFTLFESMTKKAEFLKYLTHALHLSQVQVINERAENFQTEDFDLIVIKAAGKIKKLVKVIDHLIIAGGDAVFFKSHHVEDEIRRAERDIKKRNFHIEVKKLTTPIENLPLALVILRKLAR